MRRIPVGGLLQDRVALLVGAGPGIGEVTATVFAEAGASVAAVDIDVDSATNTVAALRAGGADALAITADVRDSTQIADLVERTAQHFGTIDVLVNNVGGVERSANRRRVLDWSEDEWEQVMAQNLRYVFAMVRAVIPVMVAGGRGGAIVNVSSMAGVTSAPFKSPYGAAKAGLINLTRSVAQEWAHEGIRANTLTPGYVITPSSESGNMPELVAEIPFGRPGTPLEAAHVILFLASDLSSYVSGETIMCDGGVKTRYPFPQAPPA